MNIQRQRDILDKTKRAAYLRGDFKSNDSGQGTVRCLMGHVEGNVRLIEALPLIRPYQSVCMSFAREDQPTQQQIDAAVHDLLNVLMAGLWPGRIDPLVYQHTLTEGRIDIHIVMPRVELLTGRAFNPTPTCVRPLFKLVEQYFDAREGWCSPNHPLRHRLLVPLDRPRSPGDPNSIGEWCIRKSESIAKIIGIKVESGELKTRADVIAYFQRIDALVETNTTGIVTRWTHSTRGEHLIALRGKLFSASFNAEEVKEKLRADREGTPLFGIKNPEAAAFFKEKLDAIMVKRTETNRKTFAVDKRDRGCERRPIIPMGVAKHRLSARQQAHAASAVEELLRTVPSMGIRKTAS